MARVLDNMVISDLITILWNGVEDNDKVTWDRAAALSKDFWIFNLLEDTMVLKKAEEKINFDATIHGKKVYYGLIARNSDGFVLGGLMGNVDKEMQIEWAEMQAMEESIRVARSNNWSYLKLESDCASLVNRFNKRDSDLTMLGHLMREIQRQIQFFSYFSFSWVPRCCNKIAYFLCSWAKTNDCTKDFKMDYLLEIHEFVSNDAIK
ncbi:hypothetical protein J1N35_028810 [Gossypium stocksii]|uniref:RNase H type-1 domain-containing protein n=1 Tax=Gossypium stocksii TaxID=47602 RepID=A0A9D3UX09_9ROSI|nr:hypothetical protein J1N35_028810 [Gossypium stocksii]